jgi:hypothetical protein
MEVGGQLLVAAALTPEKEPQPPVRRLVVSRAGPEVLEKT